MATYPQVRFELAITTWDASGRRNATPLTALTFPVAGAAALTGYEDKSVPIAANATGTLYYGASSGGDASELIVAPWTFMFIQSTILLDLEITSGPTGATLRTWPLICLAGGWVLFPTPETYVNYTSAGDVFVTGTRDGLAGAVAVTGITKIRYKEPAGATGTVRMIYGK